MIIQTAQKCDIVFIFVVCGSLFQNAVWAESSRSVTDHQSSLKGDLLIVFSDAISLYCADKSSA